MAALLYSNRPLITCQRCASVGGRFLPEVSGGAVRDYYRCDDCGEVWTVEKTDYMPPVTVRPKPDRRRVPRGVPTLV